MKIPQKSNTYKMLIKLDEKKIEKESQYSIEDIENAIKRACGSINILYNNGFCTCNEYESVMAILSSISNREWIFRYIKEWNLYDSSGMVEDLLA